MSNGFYRKLTEIFKEKGCEYVCQAKGDHEKWKSPFNGRTLIVDRGVQSRYTANAVLKTAGIHARI